MNHDELLAILDGFHRSDLTSLELSRGSTVLKIARSAASSDAEKPSHSASAEEHTHSPAPAVSSSTPAPVQSVDARVTSPIHGIFHAAEKPGAAPLARVGDRVEPGQTLGILEAMKMFHPLQATQAGVVEQILCQDGDEVEAGATLFQIA